MSYADVLKKNIESIVTGVQSDPGKNIYADGGKPRQSQPTKQHHINLKKISKGNTRVFHVDAGINLSHKSLNTKLDKVLRDAVASNCRRYIVISTSLTDANKVITIVRENNKISQDEYKLYCTIGVHPHEAERTLNNPNWLQDLEELISANADIVLAVGECGLDFDRMFSPKDAQLRVFREQIRLAKKLNLPLFFHERESREAFIQVLDDEDATEEGNDNKKIRGVVHCFTGDPVTAKMYLERGFYLGITGWICDDFKNKNLVESLKTVVPVERVFVETDAPYLTPKDLQKKPYYNGPHHIAHISSKIASLLGIRRDELTSQVLRNLKTLYGDRFE